MRLRHGGAIVVLALVMTLAGFILLSLEIGKGDVADAQDSNQTWQMVDLGSWPAEEQVFDGKPVTGRSFIEQLPAECDLVISPHSDKIFYYACPFDWTPVPG